MCQQKTSADLILNGSKMTLALSISVKLSRLGAVRFQLGKS